MCPWIHYHNDRVCVYAYNEVWDKCTSYLINGYKNSPVIKDNPKYEMIEFLDGFLSHERVVSASVARRDNLIKLIKEESNSSHCNQSFDQPVAKNDKRVAAITPSKQRKLVKLRQKRSIIT